MKHQIRFKFGPVFPNDFDFSGTGHFHFSDDEIILDPSMLFYMTNHEIKEGPVVCYIPDDLKKLIEMARETKDNEYKIFLGSFLRYFGDSHSEHLERNSWTLFYKNYDKLDIRAITEEDINAYREDSFYPFYQETFSDHDFYISLSPFKNFLGSVIGKVMEFSRKKGMLVLSKSKALANRLSGKITALELPEKMDALAKLKQEITGKIFYFRGGRATKAFIGISLSVGGLVTANPIIGVGGAVFAFTDP